MTYNRVHVEDAGQVVSLHVDRSHDVLMLQHSATFSKVGLQSERLRVSAALAFEEFYTASSHYRCWDEHTSLLPDSTVKVRSPVLRMPCMFEAYWTLSHCKGSRPT